MKPVRVKSSKNLIRSGISKVSTREFFNIIMPVCGYKRPTFLPNDEIAVGVPGDGAAIASVAHCGHVFWFGNFSENAGALLQAVPVQSPEHDAVLASHDNSRVVFLREVDGQNRVPRALKR